MNLKPPCLSCPVDDPSRVAEARRAAASLAGRLGFDEAATGRASIVATELATNLLKHAGGGEILLAARGGDGAPAIQLIALDRGPGMADPAACLRDGYSTAGSAGHGLGAVLRQAAECRIWTHPGAGTAVLARIAARTPRPGGAVVPRPLPRWAGLAVPLPGEEACGDAIAAIADDDTIAIMLADGLGHGAAAALASTEAARIFAGSVGGSTGPAALLEAIDAGLRHTRGAAVAVARLSGGATPALAAAGIGNIAGVAIEPAGGAARRIVSMPGIAGHPVAVRGGRRFREYAYPLASPPLLVLHSDGLSGSWSLDRYPGLAVAHPALVAAVLYRDHARRDAFGRRSDDVAVLVARGGPGAP
jgi:anti-sigma regulatory factor (Ser/Thr protein kinase)